MSTGQKTRDDIQGLRAIAVLSVLIFHAFPHALPGGYIGVDVFFVISGYLITGIVFRAACEGRLSYAEFYRRRVRRIFPAMFVMVIPTALAGILILSPAELETLAGSMIAAIFSVSNIWFWRTSGYFATAADVQPLLHTWSLSVEEQFYIFLPFTIALLVRFARRHLTLFLAMAFVTSLVLSELLLTRSGSASYFMLPTRAFELLAGSILAVTRLPVPASVSSRGGLGAIGIVLIVAPLFLFSESTPFPGVNALYPTLGSALLLHTGNHVETNFASRAISNRPFLFFGDISYSLYLWHWPILAFLRVRYGTDLSVPMAAGALITATACAAASFRFVEQPVMKLSTSAFPFLRAGAMAIVVASMALVPVLVSKGFPGRFSAQSLELFASANAYSPARGRCHNDNGKAKPYYRNCVLGAGEGGDLIAVWGDSHGVELAYALSELTRPSGRGVMEITASHCPPAVDYVPDQRPHCRSHNRETLAGLVADPRIKTVVLAADGPSYHNDPARLLSGLEESMAALDKAGKRLVIITEMPAFHVDPPTALGYASAREEDFSSFGSAMTEYERRSGAWNAKLADLAARHGATLVSVTGALCSADFCALYDNIDGALYFNRNHPSVAGAKRIARDIVPLLAKP